MRQNASNPISICIFFCGTPGPPPLGAVPPDPRGGEGGKGQGKGKEGRDGRVSLRHCRWGIDDPMIDHLLMVNQYWQNVSVCVQVSPVWRDFGVVVS